MKYDPIPRHHCVLANACAPAPRVFWEDRLPVSYENYTLVEVGIISVIVDIKKAAVKPLKIILEL